MIFSSLRVFMRLDPPSPYFFFKPIEYAYPPFGEARFVVGGSGINYWFISDVLLGVLLVDAFQ